MKRRVKYTDKPLGKLRVVEDFLPQPEELVFKHENVPRFLKRIAMARASLRAARERKRHET